jgi:hypothetical protein
MVTDEEVGFMIFARMNAQVGRFLIVILRHISTRRFVIGRRNQYGVVCRNLLFDLCGENALFQIVVLSLPMVTAVKAFHGIASVAERPVLRAALIPTPAALIFREPTHAKTIALEQARIFLLRNSR